MQHSNIQEPHCGQMYSMMHVIVQDLGYHVLTSDAKWRRVNDLYSSVWEKLDNSTNRCVREKTGQFLR